MYTNCQTKIQYLAEENTESVRAHHVAEERVAAVNYELKREMLRIELEKFEIMKKKN